MRINTNLLNEFHFMDRAPQDRKLRQPLLKFIMKEMAEGKFRTCVWASCYCAFTKLSHRMNGQHTNTAIWKRVESGLPMGDVFITVERYKCETMAEMAELYATFDRTKSCRNQNDVNQIYSAAVESLSDVSARSINQSVNGIIHGLHNDHTKEENTTHLDPEDRACQILEYPKFALWLHSIFSPVETDEDTGSSGHLQRQSVTSCMFKGWRISRQAATEFFTAVRDASGAKPKDPDRKINAYLINAAVRGHGNTRASLNGARGPRNHKEPVTPREMHVKTIHAWNAWRKGETTRLQYHADAPIPKMI